MNDWNGRSGAAPPDPSGGIEAEEADGDEQGEEKRLVKPAPVRAIGTIAKTRQRPSGRLSFTSGIP
jgi:hypothetical protein